MSEGEEATVRNISHIVLHVNNLKKSVAFYQLLGFAVDRIISLDFNNPGDINDIDTVPLNKTDGGDYYSVGMGLGRDPKAITKLEIMQFVTPQKQPNYANPSDHIGVVRIAFTVKGLETIVARVKAQGHKVDAVEKIDISPTLSSVYAHIYDPDGNWLTLMEWIKK